MLAADISLTNHTNTTYYVGIPFAGSSCGYAPGITMTGGGEPHYNIPIATGHSCPPIFNSISLKPGQTVTAHKYLPLTDSGYVTLTAETTFLTRKVDNGFEFYTPAPSPLDRHWPSVQINVNSRIPADSQLSFKLQGSHVIVTAPPGAQTHLLYLYGVWCTDAQHPGISMTGNYGWEPISKNQLSVPACGASEVHWTFAFGAPGYAVIYGSHVYS
jgi:hypothetical protein